MDVVGGKHLPSPIHRRIGNGWVNDRGPTTEQGLQTTSLEASSQRLPDSILCIHVASATTMEGMLASDVLGYQARPTWKAYICEPITEAVERHLSDFRERTMAALCNMCMPPT
jgi:hypothetical protein